MTTVKIINKSNYPTPQYATPGSAGMDLRANIDMPSTIEPMERVIVPTGIYIELPEDCEAQIRPRSGLAAKFGVTVLNTPGTIDSDYRGQICVILINLSNHPFVIQPGDRIAQMVMAKYEHALLVEAEKISDTERGNEGFGHTGVK